MPLAVEPGLSSKQRWLQRPALVRGDLGRLQAFLERLETAAEEERADGRGRALRDPRGSEWRLMVKEPLLLYLPPPPMGTSFRSFSLEP